MKRTKVAGRKRRQTQAGSLSREKPTAQEVLALLDEMIGSPPIAIAIMGTSVVEHYLESIIRERMYRNDDVTWKEVTNEKGPLGTLSQKIVLGHAMNLYGDHIRDNLDIMRAVRNAFAHTKKLIDFDNEKIVNELRAVSGKPSKRYGGYGALKVGDTLGARAAYMSLCMSLTIDLMGVSTRASKRASARWERKHGKSPHIKEIAAILAGEEPSTPRARLIAALITSEGSQTSNPKPATQPPTYYEHFLAAGKTDRSKGK